MRSLIVAVHCDVCLLEEKRVDAGLSLIYRTSETGTDRVIDLCEHHQNEIAVVDLADEVLGRPYEQEKAPRKSRAKAKPEPEVTTRSYVRTPVDAVCPVCHVKYHSLQGLGSHMKARHPDDFQAIRKSA